MIRNKDKFLKKKGLKIKYCLTYFVIIIKDAKFNRPDYI